VAYVASITNVLSDYLGWHRARLIFMARFICWVLTLQTTDLWRITPSLKAGSATYNHHRIQRFLASYDLDSVVFERLLVHLVQTSPPYLITIDRIEWHVGSEPVNVLAAEISLDGEVALPVAWGRCRKEADPAQASKFRSSISCLRASMSVKSKPLWRTASLPRSSG
jgi:hypothetical protein